MNSSGTNKLSPRRWWGTAVVLFAVLVMGAYFRFTPATDAVGSSVADVGAHPPSALFIGDSYTEGPSTPDASYGCMTASALGWKCAIAAQGGTGYVTGGPGHRVQLGESVPPSTSFVERLPHLRQLYQPDIVVIDGGRNDVELDIQEVDRTLAYTVRQVIEAWPKSRIAVIAPWFVNEPVIKPTALAGRTIGDEFRSVLRSSHDFDSVDLVDPGALGWFTGVDTSSYLSSDGIHPNTEGVKKIAEMLTAAFADEGFARRS
jgi:GDSL-like Lipase/Acylhydrolase family